MRIVDIQLSFPSILVALIILAAFGKGVEKTIIALILVQWAYYARTARSSALVEINKEYVDAARCLAFGNTRIMFKHILPNCMAPLIVVGTLQTSTRNFFRSHTKFFGFRSSNNRTFFGSSNGNGFEYMYSGDFWISIFPGVALLITVASINLVGDHLRDMFNPSFTKISNNSHLIYTQVLLLFYLEIIFWKA